MTAPEFKPFWRELALGRLSFPRCEACTRHHWYPMKRCPHCLSNDVRWVPVANRGTVYSWTTVCHRFDGSHAGDVPYVVALLEFEDAPGVRLITNLIEIGEADPFIGMLVEPCFELSGTDGGPRICFHPERGARSSIGR